MKKRAALLGLILAVSLCSCKSLGGGREQPPKDAGEGVTIRITRSGGGRTSAMTVEVSPGDWDGEIVLHIDPDQ